MHQSSSCGATNPFVFVTLITVKLSVSISEWGLWGECVGRARKDSCWWRVWVRIIHVWNNTYSCSIQVFNFSAGSSSRKLNQFGASIHTSSVRESKVLVFWNSHLESYIVHVCHFHSIKCKSWTVFPCRPFSLRLNCGDECADGLKFHIFFLINNWKNFQISDNLK